MERYSEYKDSGEQWLGKIPSHWEVKRWHVLMNENTEQNTNCSVTKQLQFKYGSIIEKNNQDEDKEVLETISKYLVVKPGDIMLNGLNLNYDFVSQRVGQVTQNGVITSAYICLRPTGRANENYLVYLLKAMDSQKLFHGMGTGVRLTLSYKELKNVNLVLPPLSEQSAIVSYLDRVTSQLDEAIAQQQRMIDLLNERKQIIIQHAVTKGLDHKAEMVESGVEWIGMMPRGWKAIKTSYIYNKIGSGTTPSSASNEFYSEEGINFLQTGDLNDGHIRATSKHITSQAQSNTGLKLYAVGSLVIAMYGATIGKLGILDVPVCVNQACCVLSNSNLVHTDFAFYAYMSARKDLIFQARGGGQPNISQDTIRNERIPIPPLEEQQNIVNYIQSMCNPLSMQIKNCNKQITLLRERKQIIINEVVTGKVKVS